MILREKIRKAQLYNTALFDDLHCYIVYDDIGMHHFSTNLDELMDKYGDETPKWIYVTKSLIDEKFLVEIWL